MRKRVHIFTLRRSKVQILVIVKDMFILFLVKPIENLLQIKGYIYMKLKLSMINQPFHHPNIASS